MGKKIKFTLTNMFSRLKPVIILITALLLFSCHSEYLSLDYSIHHWPCVTEDSLFVVFALSKKAYRAPEGIARFPDGGTPDYLVEDVGLYMLNRKNKKVKEIATFCDMSSVIGSSRSAWDIGINIDDGFIAYKVRPVSDWEIYKRMPGAKAEEINLVAEKYSKKYIYVLETENTEVLYDESIGTECLTEKRFGITELSGELTNVPLSEIGFVLRDIYPKSDAEYIDETIYLKNNSELTRRAVVEQIISKMGKDEIAGLLKKMDEYKNSLEGLERSRYEMYSKDTYDIIKDLIRTWTDIIFYDVTSFDQTVFVRLPEQEKVTVNIFPGNGKSKEEFTKHSRPKKLKVTILSGIHADGFVSETATLYKGLEFKDPVFIELDDSYGIQSFEIDLPLKEIENISRLAEKKFTQEFGFEVIDKCIALKIEVTDVYPGTESQDTCISEVFTGDFYESEGSIKVSDVFVNDDENAILAATEGDKEIEIYSDRSSVLQLMEVSSNKKWAIVILMPAEIDGRAGTEYLLLDITKGEVINEKIGALSGGMMYFEKPWAELETLNYTGEDRKERKIYLK